MTFSNQIVFTVLRWTARIVVRLISCRPNGRDDGRHEISEKQGKFIGFVPSRPC